MLDRDLAELYEVQTKALNQAVRRNRDRFPADFMFQLSEKEVADLNRSQFVTGSEKHRATRLQPWLILNPVHFQNKVTLLTSARLIHSELPE
jgi:ORF6N domain